LIAFLELIRKLKRLRYLKNGFIVATAQKFHCFLKPNSDTRNLELDGETMRHDSNLANLTN